MRNFIWLDICRNTWISPLPCHSQLVVTAVAPGKLQIIRFLLSKPGDWQIFMRCKIVCIFTSKLALSQFSACQWFRIMVFVWTVDCSWGHGSWPSDGEWHICQYGRLVAFSAKQKESNHYQGRVSHLLKGRVDWFWRLERLNLTRQLAYSRPVERSRVVCFYHDQHHHSLASWKICGRPTFPFSCPGSWGRELVSIPTKQLMITMMTWWLLDNFRMMMMMTTKLNWWWPDDSNGCKEGMVDVFLTGRQRQWGVLG